MEKKTYTNEPTPEALELANAIIKTISNKKSNYANAEQALAVVAEKIKQVSFVSADAVSNLI